MKRVNKFRYLFLGMICSFMMCCGLTMLAQARGNSDQVSVEYSPVREALGEMTLRFEIEGEGQVFVDGQQVRHGDVLGVKYQDQMNITFYYKVGHSLKEVSCDGEDLLEQIVQEENHKLLRFQMGDQDAVMKVVFQKDGTGIDEIVRTVKTGDLTQPGNWMIVFLVSGGVLMCYEYLRRKKEKEQHEI